MEIGDKIKRKGYVTQLKYLKKKKGPQLEKLLGYKAGRLGFGWAMLYLTKMPKPDDFDLAGGAGMSGPIDLGQLENPLDRKLAKKHQREQGFDMPALKNAILKDLFAIKGSKRLVKVVPNKPPSKTKDYPPDMKIPQWELTSKLSFKVAAIILPEGITWQTE